MLFPTESLPMGLTGLNTARKSWQPLSASSILRNHRNVIATGMVQISMAMSQSNDMLYIPKDPSEITFVDRFRAGGRNYTPKQQSDAFFAFIENDKYLRKHKGQVIEKYGALLPWNHSAGSSCNAGLYFQNRYQKTYRSV